MDPESSVTTDTDAKVVQQPAVTTDVDDHGQLPVLVVTTDADDQLGHSTTSSHHRR